MLLRRLAVAASLVLAPAVAPAVAGAQQSFTFAPSQPGALNNGSYLVGPFAGTVTPAVGQATSVTVFCVDLLNTVSNGDTFAVHVSSLADGSDLSKTRHPSMMTAYRKAAWISSYFGAAPQQYWTPMQYAMWDVMNPGSAPAATYKAEVLALANYAASQNFGAFSLYGMDFAAFDYSRYAVLTDVRSAGVTDDAFKQEFITGSLPVTATPEPATFALLAGGLLATGAAARRRRVRRDA